MSRTYILRITVNCDCCYSYYIILRGTVSVHISTTMADMDADDSATPATEEALVFNEQGELDRTRFGNHITQLGQW